LSDRRPGDSEEPEVGSSESTGESRGPIGRRADEYRDREQARREAREDAAREDPLEASKGSAERAGDRGTSKLNDAKAALGTGKDRINVGLNRVAEGDGVAGKAARGAQTVQKAAQVVHSLAESAKAIAVSAKGFVVALGNPYSLIAIAVVIVLTFITLTVVTGVQVYGKNDSVDNCTANGSVSGVEVPTDASVEENRDAMMGWLMQNNFKSNGNKPLTKEQAAAVAGNFAAESGFGFDVTEGHTMDGASNEQVDAWTRGGARGLGMAQWTFNPGRAGTLIELAKSMGKNWYDPEVQFQMILNEMDGAYGPRLASAGFFAGGGQPGPLAIIFHDIYEGSADTPSMKERRAQMAEDAFANGKAGGYSSSGGDNCQQNSPSGDWVYPLEMRNGEPLNWVTRFGSQDHEAGALDINGVGNGGAPTDWPVYAASDGVVLSIGDSNCSPLTIWHEKDKVASIYLHMNSKVVKAGDTVEAGQHIGGVGTKGCGSTGNHLHFGIRPDNKFGSKMPAWSFMQEHGVDMGRCVGESSSACALGGAPYSG
jgi:hypothetical protein